MSELVDANIPELTPQSRTLLESEYLEKPYVEPPEVEAMLDGVATQLRATIPGFECVVNVGGTANGSLQMRRLENPNASTDLDIYFVGHTEMIDHLADASDAVAIDARKIGLSMDGELNGRSIYNFLNLDDLLGHIEREELNLLALPFQSAHGEANEAQRKVLEVLVAHPNGQALWDEVASYHAQSLSLHHGSWSEAFSNKVLQEYYPEKIARYELPQTPQEAMAALQASTPQA